MEEDKQHKEDYEEKKQEVKVESPKIKEVKEEEKEEQDEEISINFNKFKGLFKRKKKEKSHEPHTHHKDDDSVDIDWKKTSKKIAKYSFVLLILIPLFLALFYRVQPAYLPVTDNWATSTVENYFMNNIASEIEQQYPNLPDQNKQNLINAEFQKFLRENEDEVNSQVNQLSNQYKEQLQDDETDHTYLLAIDPYYWQRHAKNIIENGHPGDDLRNPETEEICNEKGPNCVPWNNHMLAPVGRPSSSDMFNAYVMAYLYKFVSIFNSNLDLMVLAFYIPVLFSMLSVIPAFYIAKRIGGKVAGLFAAVIVAVHPAFLNRTAGGFADTDAYNVFFPLLISWLFLEAFETTDRKKKIWLSALAGFFIGVYAYSWTGWWYIFDFILATVVIFVIIKLILNYKKQGFKKFWKRSYVKNSLLFLIVFIVVSGIFVSWFISFNSFKNAPQNPLSIITIHEIGKGGSVWPNVYTTVAEQNEISYEGVISQISFGRKLFFFLAILGIIFSIIKKDEEGNRDIKYAIFLTIWFIASIYGSSKGVRFILLLVPGFAIAFGVFIGVIHKYASKWFSKGFHLNKTVTSIFIILILSFSLIIPLRSAYGTAVNEIPSMNDAWHFSLSNIAEKSEPDAIINSWWDFGHWFKNIGDRAVTFDGTSQSRPQAHWIGLALKTDNEDLSVGILRMLDCGATGAFDELNKKIDDPVKSIDILYEILVLDKNSAIQKLNQYGLDSEETNSVIKNTHCEPPENYFITSQDMVGKSGVWAHFGSWDFRRATIHNLLQLEEYQDDFEKAVEKLQQDFEITKEESENIYYEVQALASDREVNDWIAPWPGYAGTSACEDQGGIIICDNGLQINLEAKEAYFQNADGKLIYPRKISMPIGNDIFVKTYDKDVLSQGGRSIGAALTKINDKYVLVLMDEVLTGSMFTRLFYQDGHGLKHFKKFSDVNDVFNQRIIVWNVDWKGNEKNNALNFEIKVEEQLMTSHILVETEEEAINIIEQLNNGSDFAELARENSLDPGSAATGGDLGWFGRGMMVKEFEDVAFALEKGEVSDIVKTQFGYHIIKLIDKQ